MVGVAQELIDNNPLASFSTRLTLTSLAEHTCEITGTALPGGPSTRHSPMHKSSSKSEITCSLDPQSRHTVSQYIHTDVVSAADSTNRRR